MKALLIIAIVLAVQPTKPENTQRTPQGKNAPSTQQSDASNGDRDNPRSASVSVTVNNVPASQNPQTKTDDLDENMRVQRSVARYTGLLVMVGLATAIAIFWQSLETRRAAQAASKSAAALVNAERAWLTAKVENIHPDGSQLIHIGIPITNNGRTSAKVKTIRVTRRLVPFPKNGWGRPGPLPDAPVYDPEPTNVIEGKDFIIPPHGAFHAYVLIFPRDFEQMQKRESSLYVHGEIVYLDTINGDQHRTCFCEVYFVASPEFNEPEGFIFAANLIPKAYICAT